MLGVLAGKALAAIKIDCLKRGVSGAMVPWAPLFSCPPCAAGGAALHAAGTLRPAHALRARSGKKLFAINNLMVNPWFWGGCGTRLSLSGQISAHPPADG